MKEWSQDSEAATEYKSLIQLTDMAPLPQRNLFTA